MEAIHIILLVLFSIGISLWGIKYDTDTADEFGFKYATSEIVKLVILRFLIVAVATSIIILITT